MLERVLSNILFIEFAFCFYQRIKNGLHMLQLESYKNERYSRWMKENKKVVWKSSYVLFLVPIFLLLLQLPFYALLSEIIIYGMFFFFNKTQKQKKPFVVTARIKRMYITYGIIGVLVGILANMVGMINVFVIFTIVLFILSYLSVLLVNGINNPIEKSIQKKFYQQAKKKLEEMPNLKIIGITGSYGKTSMKYIAQTILSQKYDVLMTPESYNTTMGVVRTINEKLKATHQYFVCEMGAKNIGDIKEICDLVNPTYGILTAIGPQHLETFKTIENVKKTKMELIDSVPQEGIGFVNYEDENIRTIDFEKNMIKYGLHKDADYYAKDIQITEEGSQFEVVLKNSKSIHVKTKLLGEHNVLNIVGAIAVADNMGLTEEEIRAGVRFLKPVPHRLELKKNANGSIIIDDAYNSNSKGAKMALDTLKRFQDRKRILITPGIVDLGEESAFYNKQLGEQAAESADYIILVGEKQAKPILEGIKEKKYPENQVFVAKNLEEALQKMKEMMDKTSVILLENDLPDNYL